MNWKGKQTVFFHASLNKKQKKRKPTPWIYSWLKWGSERSRAGFQQIQVLPFTKTETLAGAVMHLLMRSLCHTQE